VAEREASDVIRVSVDRPAKFSKERLAGFFRASQTLQVWSGFLGSAKRTARDNLPMGLVNPGRG